jgi:mono/diheme cytochrome c family protein/plastocyanin
MTDTPGREPEGQVPEGQEPEPEQRLPVPRPPVEAAPVERFSSPPSTRAFALTPERAAQVVRQSANARWVGFLAVIVVVLFVALYWFYELGGPMGISQPRLEAEAGAQQVMAVERGYNVYQANCARCHGEDGEGGIGPVLNRQDKLFSHLNEDYLRNILNVGGRLACGDPNSIMPIWADSGHPPGPLNYRQIDELIAFIRSPSDQTFTVRHPELLDPEVDPVTGEVETFQGWVDPNYLPAPDSTPYPACWKDEFASASASPGASEAPGASVDPGAQVVTVTASGIAFTTTEVAAPSGVGFTLRFDNQDAGIPHDVQIKDEAGQVVFKTDITTGPDTSDFAVPALDPGTYPFVCSVHPNMTGNLNAE